MIYWLSKLRPKNEPLGALTSELQVRVLNGSATGCLVETTRAVKVGAVARLRVDLRGREYDDEVQVTRCQLIVGAGEIFHVAMKFLSTTPPYAGTLRYAIHRELGQFAAWLNAPDNAADQPADA